MAFLFLISMTLLAWTQVPAQDDPQARIEARIAEYDATYAAWYEEYLAAEGSQAVLKAIPDPVPCGARLMDLAAEAPGGDGAARACGWVLQNVRGGEPLATAVAHVLAHLTEHAEIDELARNMLRAGDYLPRDVRQESQRWLLDHADSTELAAQACYALALDLKYQVLAGGDPEALTLLEQEAEHYFARCTSEPFASVRYQGDATLAQQARRDVFEMKQLRIGEVAPPIAGEDVDGVPFALEDYRGKVVMLSFWGDW